MAFLFECFTGFSQNQESLLNKNGDLFQNSFTYNPAYTGINGIKRIYLRSHFYWPFSTFHPITINMAYDMAVGKKKFFGFGFYYNINSDNEITTHTIDLSYAFHFRIGKNARLSWGTDWFNYNIMAFGDLTSLSTLDPADALIRKYDNTRKKFINLNTGLWFEYKSFFAGAAIRNIMQLSKKYRSDNQSVFNVPYTLPFEFNCTAGIDIKMSQKWNIQPILDVTKVRYISPEFSPSVYFNHEETYTAGLSCENMRIIILHYGRLLFNKLEIGGSAGFPINKLIKTNKIAVIGFNTQLHF